MAAEAKELRPGGETVITRLADIPVIRSSIAQDPSAQTGWLGALQDTLRQIQEIRTYYDFPDIDIDRYEIAMSRSAFEQRGQGLMMRPAVDS
jgi:hypothetical protein